MPVHFKRHAHFHCNQNTSGCVRLHSTASPWSWDGWLSQLLATYRKCVTSWSTCFPELWWKWCITYFCSMKPNSLRSVISLSFLSMMDSLKFSSVCVCCDEWLLDTGWSRLMLDGNLLIATVLFELRPNLSKFVRGSGCGCGVWISMLQYQVGKWHSICNRSAHACYRTTNTSGRGFSLLTAWINWDVRGCWSMVSICSLRQVLACASVMMMM